MKENNKTSFLSDNIRDCFLEIFDKAFYKCGETFYNISLHSVVNYLIDPDSIAYNNVLQKYPDVNKKLINQMVYAKFMELNYYRIKNDIMIDNKRASLLKEATAEFVSIINQGVGKGRIHLSVDDASIIVNDAYLYSIHFLDDFSKNIIKDNKEDCFDEIVSIFYPLTRIDHIENLIDPTSEKEDIYGKLYTETINSIERNQFNNNETPIPSVYYYKRCKKILDRENLYEDIINNFIKKISLDYNEIIYVMEMANSILDFKSSYINDLDIKIAMTDEEKLLLKQLKMIVNDRDKNLILFNSRKNTILRILISNIFVFNKNDFFNFDFDFNINNSK